MYEYVYVYICMYTYSFILLAYPGKKLSDIKNSKK